MSWRVITGLLFAWVITALLCGGLTLTYFGTNNTNLISLILSPQTPSYTNPVGGISTTVSTSAQWISAFFSAMFFDFPLFTGDYAIIRVLILTIFIGILAVQILQGIKPA